MKWQLIIFDCDGVLVDSEVIQNRVFAHMLGQAGLAISFEEVVRQFVGLKMSQCLEIVEQRLGRALPVDFEARLQDQTFAAFERELKPVRGITQALDSIDAAVCVASNGSQEKMRKTLELTGLLSHFEGRMFSATQVARPKPHPDLYLHAARKLGADPVTCAVIEDSRTGVQAAVAAQMTVFGYAAAGQGQALAAAGARVFDDMRELPDLLRAEP
ncbi:MAG: HAD family hydrolase [Gammaproteobacteria bacterium]|nr:HAD family hydrolase [Gammaproteobacteria bacterium]